MSTDEVAEIQRWADKRWERLLKAADAPGT
jgi:hypothetical protein